MLIKLLRLPDDIYCLRNILVEERNMQARSTLTVVINYSCNIFVRNFWMSCFLFPLLFLFLFFTPFFAAVVRRWSA